MLGRRRQIPVPPVAQAYHDGARERALLLQLQTGLGKGLERHGADHGVADLDGLDDDVDGLFGTIRRGDGPGGVMLGEPRQPFDGFLVLHGQDGLGVHELLVRRLAVLERDEALPHPEHDVVPVLLDVAHGPPGGVRGFARHDPHLLERLPGRPAGGEGRIIDIAGSAVRHGCDEPFAGAEARRHEAGELAVIIRRDLPGRDGADIMERIIGEQGQRLPLGVDDRHDADVRIRRTGRLVQDVR